MSIALRTQAHRGEAQARGVSRAVCVCLLWGIAACSNASGAPPSGAAGAAGHPVANPGSVSGGTIGPVTSLAVGNGSACVIAAGGSVYCWGNNQQGELGDGTNSSSAAPVPVTGLSSGVTAVGTNGPACALTEAGGVLCWGTGALGNGTSGESNVPVQVVGLESGVTAIGVGPISGCALVADGGVRCWGLNVLEPEAVTGLAGPITAISVGLYACGVTSAGGVDCWGQLPGDGSSPVASHVLNLPGAATSVAAGFLSSCAIVEGGSVVCWDGLGDQSGKSDSASWIAGGSLSPAPVENLARGVTAVAVGNSDACAILGGGSVSCWGYSLFGLGDGTTANSMTPVQVTGLTNGVAAVAVGTHSSCAITADGGVSCWGGNDGGKMFGPNNTKTTLAAVPIQVIAP